MSLLNVSTIPFALRWYKAVNACQDKHRFHQHSQQEYEYFIRMLEK
jgi:hypothetical protein